MLASLENIHFLIPEINLLITGIVCLLFAVFSNRESLMFSVATVGLLIAAIFSRLYMSDFPHVILHGLFISDNLAHLLKLFIYVVVFLSFYYSRSYLRERKMPSGDYYVLGLFSTLGMMILVSAHSLLIIYLGLELVSLPVYAMTAIRRLNSNGSEAALKYFVMGALASAFLLFGISFVYGVTGELDLQQVANYISIMPSEKSLMLSFALVFIISATGFKMAAVPFHMWAPDVYEGAPTSVTLFISTAPKIAAVGMMLRILTLAFSSLVAEWQILVIILALLSTCFGNLLAIVQKNIKRLFAYSAIAHMGYILFGIAAGTTAGYSAAVYYVLIYAIMTAGAFGLLVLLSQSGTEIENIDDLKGLNKRSPWLAFLMLVMLFSMAGVPPTVGFFAKLLVLRALVDVQMTWIAIIGLIFAAVGAFYYIRIVKIMYFEDSSHDTTNPTSFTQRMVLSLNGLVLLIWGLFPSTIIQMCMNAFNL